MRQVAAVVRDQKHFTRWCVREVEIASQQHKNSLNRFENKYSYYFFFKGGRLEKWLPYR